MPQPIHVTVSARSYPSWPVLMYLLRIPTYRRKLFNPRKPRRRRRIRNVELHSHPHLDALLDIPLQSAPHDVFIIPCICSPFLIYIPGPAEHETTDGVARLGALFEHRRHVLHVPGQDVGLPEYADRLEGGVRDLVLLPDGLLEAR